MTHQDECDVRLRVRSPVSQAGKTGSTPVRRTAWRGTQTGKAARSRAWRLWVQLPPTLLPVSAGHRRAQAAVTRPQVLCRFDSCPTHSSLARWWKGRHAGFRAWCPPGVRVQVPPWLLTFRGRLTVGRRALNPSMLVRPQPPELAALVVKRTSRDSPKVEAQVRLLAGVLVLALRW